MKANNETSVKFTTDDHRNNYRTEDLPDWGHSDYILKFWAGGSFKHRAQGEQLVQ